MYYKKCESKLEYYSFAIIKKEIFLIILFAFFTLYNAILFKFLLKNKSFKGDAGNYDLCFLLYFQDLFAKL